MEGLQMSKLDDRQIAANYMGAVAHLLGGRRGRHAEFVDKVELILSGSPPHAMQLMQFYETVRRTGRPVLWIHHTPEMPHVPNIGLVALVGNEVRAFENCLLWTPAGSGRTCLVPDNFQFGAFRFDDKLRLRHQPTAPAVCFEAAQDAIVRAYVRLREIEAVQRERGDVFRLPELAKAA
jgi:hypothetical protein